MNHSKSVSLKATKAMLDENMFWNIVEKSLEGTESQEEQESVLIEELEKLSPEEIIGFRLRTDKLLFDTYNSEMWCAAYLINGGCSDDSFEYFRCWVISRGKDVYVKAKKNPDSLVNIIDPNVEFYDFESFWAVAINAFEKKTGKELYDYIDDEFKFNEANYPGIEFNWSEGNPETWKKICPRLYEKLSNIKFNLT